MGIGSKTPYAQDDAKGRKMTFPGSDDPHMKNLRQKTGKAVALNTLGNWIVAALGLISLFIVARLLGPVPIGEFALIMVCLAFPQALLTSSLNESLVQRESISSGHLDTTFALGILLAILFTSVIAAASGTLMELLGTPHLVSALLVTSGLLIVEALMNVPNGLLQRRLQYESFLIIDVASSFISVCVGIVSAILLRSVWALVIAEMSRRLVRLVLTYYLSKWRPGAHIQLSYIQDLAAFNGFISVITLLQTYVKELPRIVIGAALGTASLGFFNLALRLHDQGKSILVNPIGAVALPVASEFSRENYDPRNMITSAIGLTTFTAYPMFIGAAILAPLAIPQLFGGQWIEAVPVVQIALLMALRSPSGALNSGILKGYGKPKAALYIQLFNAITLTLLILVLIEYGLVVVMWAILAQRFASWILSGWFVQTIIQFPLYRQILIGWKPMLASIIMALGVWLYVRMFETGMHNIPLLVSAVVWGVGLYIIAVLVLMPSLRLTLLKLIKERQLLNLKYAIPKLTAAIL